MSRCLALALALLGAGPAAAQTVGGRVHEQGTGALIGGATVSLRQLGGTAQASTTTDSAGAFTLALAARSARYLLEVTHPAYLALRDTLALREGEAVTLQLQLGREAIPLQPVRVQARAQGRLQGYYERLARGTGFGRFMTREQLDRIPANRTSDYLRRIPGIRLETANGGRTVTIHNGLGVCTPLVYLDGMPIEQRGPDDLDDMLRPDMIEGIEMYVGTVGMPPEFAAAQQAGCGLIALWTQNPRGRQLTWQKVALSLAAISAFVMTSLKIML